MLCRAVSWKPHLSRTCRHLRQFTQMRVNLGKCKLTYWRLRTPFKPPVRHGDRVIRKYIGATCHSDKNDVR